MGKDPLSGACKQTGETWEVSGLYCGDSSLFPTASGVNPMVTTYSLAYLVAQEVKIELLAASNAKL
jgi:choline dehydrogenase-like flavoprotein